MKILIAEDDRAMQKIIGAYLKKEGYLISIANNGEEALEKIYDTQFDLVILDWMMPHMSGVEVCQIIKQNGLDVKVMMLTAKTEIEDELKGLELGADDYVKKPFDPRILLLRIKKLLGTEEVLSHGNLIFYINKSYVEVNGTKILLSKIEQRLLHYFMKNIGIILSREKLLTHVWGMDYDGDDRTVDTHIRRLRKKIGEQAIITYRGIGYSLVDKYE
ncbi:MAG: response regulator transcription factor [Cellulosilyticaceae bacterium]